MSTEKTSRDAFNPEREFMDRVEIEERQDRKLREQVEYAYENTDYYREAFDDAGVDPSSVKTRDDYQRLVPTMLKSDIRENRSESDPYGGFLAIDESEIDYIHTSTGTTGVPTRMPLTKAEVHAGSETHARVLTQGGLDADDTVVNRGFFYHIYSRIQQYAISERIGATHFNRGVFQDSLEENVEKVLELWKAHDPAYIGGVDELTRVFQDHDIDPKEEFPSLKFMLTAGRVVTAAQREQLEEFWGVPLLEQGGPSDVMNGITMLCEAREDSWGHFHEDLGFVEVLDFDTLEPVAEGERGEHAYTTFHMRSTPYLRWRSEDAGVHGGYDCSCGRCHLRSKILGRTVQQVSVQGKPIFPRDVQRVRDRWGYQGWPYQMVRRSEQPQEALEVLFSAPMDEDEREEIEADLADSTGVPVELDRVDEDDIPLKGGWKPKIIRGVD